MVKQLARGKERLTNAYWSMVGMASVAMLSLQPVMADTIWDRFSTILQDIYGQVVAISTIVAVTVGAIATFCYDATRDGAYILCFLDGDIFRLKAFWDTVRVQKYKASIICFPEQVPFLRSYLRDKVSLQTVTMETVENAIYEGCDSNE